MLAYLDTLIGFAVVMLGASLLITIATQMISALFSHRGSNLKWGLETMFAHVGIPDPANASVAHDVLTHPLVSDSIFSGWKWLAGRVKLATAISPDDLVAILQGLATGKYAGTPTAAAITAFLADPNVAVNRRILQLTGAANLPAALSVAGVTPVLEHTVESLRDSAGKLESWFNATMDRVSARFTTYIRLWTVAFAVTLALGTGLNAVTLLNNIYTNGDFRAQLVAAGPQVLDLTRKVLPEDSKTTISGMYTSAVANALQDAKVTTTPPASVADDDAARAWITANVTNATQQKAVLDAYGKAITAALNQGLENAKTVQTILTKASFDLKDFGWNPSRPWQSQFPGVLITAALLSLGAPFWFNMLKQLTNLRPILANKQDAPAK